jgi:hypothetical protein
MAISFEDKSFQEGNKIPGSRILFSQVFAFFANFDHLWLYFYHKRQYSSYVKLFLESIRGMEK